MAFEKDFRSYGEPTLTDRLLREVVLELQLSRWLSSGARGDRPGGIALEGDYPTVADRHFGADPLPMTEMSEWLGWRDVAS